MARTAKRRRRLWDAYSFPGFRPQPTVRGIFGDPKARVITLHRRLRRLDCRRCGKVKREQLDCLADNPLYTKRFAYYVGRRCRAGTIKDVAAELKLESLTTIR